MGGLVQLVKSTASSAMSKLKGDTQSALDAKFPDMPPDPDSTIDPDMAEGWINDNFQRVKTAFTTYHQMVWQCLLFYVGQTWLTWDIYRKSWGFAVPEDDFTPQPRINYFSPAIDSIASNFSSIPPIECMAKDADGDEQYKRNGIAKVCNRLADDLLIRAGLKSDFQNKGDRAAEASMMFVLSGSLLTYVQARDKAPIQSDTLGEIAEKEVCIELVNALFVSPRPGSPDLGGIDGTPYIFLSRRMTIQEAYSRFKVNIQADRESVDTYNQEFENALNYYYVGFNSSTMQNEDSGLVNEVFVPPASEDSPGVREFAENGMYAVYANQALKYYEDWKFPEHPLTKMDYIRVPRLFFGRTPAFDLCPVQEEIQSYESIIKLHAMTNAVSPWVVDANTLVGDITGRADKIIKYRSLGPNSPAPHRSAPGTLDQGVYEQRQHLQSNVQDISGAASVFRGRQEGSVVAASAIAQLRGQAELTFAKPVQNWNNGWKETVRKGVVFMQKCYTLPQLLRITTCTPDEIRDFLAADLSEVVEWMASAHGLPRTQDEQRQEILTLFDKKALDMKDPNVKEKVFALFGETGMLTQFNLDATRARFENKGMKTGVSPTFRPAIEDLETHYALHTEFVKSLEFDKLPPPAQEVFLAHIMETKAAMAPPPPPPAPPPTIAITGKLEDLPAPLTDSLLEAHGIKPAPIVAPPPPHHVGKPVAMGGEPPVPTGHLPGQNPPPTTGPNEHRPGNLASQGKPTGSPLLEGQGIHPVGTSQGAPPKPPSQ